MSRTMRRVVLLAVLVLVVAGAAGASATDGRAATTKLTGCRNTSTGTLDQVKAGLLPMGGACGAGEVAVTWTKRGPRGYTGATGAPGVSGYQRVQTTVSVTETMYSLGADCPAGKKVVGGGFVVSSAVAYASQSYPWDDDTWVVSVYKTSGATPWWLTVYAICVTALP
jgi:hypothetical protein